MKKYPEMDIREREKCDAYLTETRKHLSEEHKRWGETTFKILLLANTGGVAITVGLLGQPQGAGKAPFLLQMSMTLFVLGALATLLSVYNEFRGITKRLNKWDNNTTSVRRGDITTHEAYDQDSSMAKITLFDNLVGFLPAILLVSGSLLGLINLWAR